MDFVCCGVGTGAIDASDARQRVYIPLRSPCDITYEWIIFTLATSVGGKLVFVDFAEYC